MRIARHHQPTKRIIYSPVRNSGTSRAHTKDKTFIDFDINRVMAYVRRYLRFDILFVMYERAIHNY